MSLCNNDNWKEVRRDVKLPSEIWCFYKEWEQLASQLSWWDYSANKELRVGNKDFLITYDDVSNARTEAPFPASCHPFLAWAVLWDSQWVSPQWTKTSIYKAATLHKERRGKCTVWRAVGDWESCSEIRNYLTLRREMELKGLCRSKRYHKISQNSLLLCMAQEEKV